MLCVLGLLFDLATYRPIFYHQFYAGSESYLNASFYLVTQVILGWIFGLVYAKTCSIFPEMIAHLFTDGRLGSVILHLMLI